MGESLGIRQVIDRHNLYVRVRNYTPQEYSAYTPKPVYCNSHSTKNILGKVTKIKSGGIGSVPAEVMILKFISLSDKQVFHSHAFAFFRTDKEGNGPVKYEAN